MNRSYRYTRRYKRRMPVWQMAVLDVLAAAAIIGVYGLLRHTFPRNLYDVPVALPGVSATVPASTPSPVPNHTEGASATPGTATSPSPQVDYGMWGEKFQDKFTDGAVEQTANTYRSHDVNITVTTVQKDGVTYHVADVYVRNLENFRTGFAQGEAGKAKTEHMLDTAKRENALVAISGDFYGAHDIGLVIRNGMLYRDTPYEDVLVMYNDGTMATYTNEELNLEEVKSKGAYQAWAFGPMLLKDGQPMETFNSTLKPRNPRSAIGYYEPGHYCLVVVDGRQEGYSVGMTLKELSQMFFDLGCKAAYNLDGGATAAMSFEDELVSKPSEGGRPVSDIVYIGEASAGGE